MCGDAVQEPAVVADDHGAPREVLQRSLERAQCVDVEIVGGFVEQQHVAARLEQLREVHPVALAAREIAHAFLLVAALEIEARHVSAAIDLSVADLHVLDVVGDLLIDGCVIVEAVPTLIHIGHLHRVADGDGAGIAGLLGGEHLEQRGLAGAVRPDDANDARTGQREREVLDEQTVAERLAQVTDLDHRVAKTRSGRDHDLQTIGAALGSLGLALQTVVGREARLALGLAGLWRHAHPLELALQRTAAILVALLLAQHALLLLLEPAGVVAFERDSLAAVELEDPLGDIVQEVSVVGDRNDSAVVVLEETFEPFDTLGIEMVGWFVEQQQIGMAEQQTAQGDATTLAAAERGDVGVVGRATQGVHRDLDVALETPRVGCGDLVFEVSL